MTIQRSLFTGTGTRGLNSTRVMPLWRPATPEGENHEDASCCRHSCDGDRSPRSGEGEAGEIGAPARLSVVGATRLLPTLCRIGTATRYRATDLRSRRLVSGGGSVKFAPLYPNCRCRSQYPSLRAQISATIAQHPTKRRTGIRAMRAIGLVLLSIAIMALLLTDADAKRRSSAQGSQAAGA